MLTNQEKLEKAKKCKYYKYHYNYSRYNPQLPDSIREGTVIAHTEKEAEKFAKAKDERCCYGSTCFRSIISKDPEPLVLGKDYILEVVHRYTETGWEKPSWIVPKEIY